MTISMITSLRQEKGFYRGLFALMAPMVLQSLLTNLLTFADTFMVGALGEIELAAVAVANSPFSVLMFACFGIQSGTSILVAQYHGQENQKAINRVMGAGLYVSIVLTAAAGLASVVFPREIMRLLTNSAELVEPGAEYMRIVGFSYFFSSISGLYLSVLRSMAMPKLGAIVLSCSGILGILLNWVFIFGNLGAPALGIKGAAYATLTVRILEVAAVIVYALSGKRLTLNPRLILRPGLLMLKDFAKYSLPVVFNEILWSGAMAVYTVIMGHMQASTRILAAYSIAGSIDRLISVGMIAVASAAAITIGNEIGRGNKETAYGKAVSLTFISIAGGLIALAFTLVVRYFAAEQFLFPVLGLGGDARGTALYMLTATAVTLPFRGINMCCIVGLFRSGGDVRFALILDLLPIYLLCIPTSAILGLIIGLDIHVVYICFLLDEIIKVTFSLRRLISKKWLNVLTRENM